ncbi:MAG: hypothetical protein AAFR01_01280, partial [Pseudomonadota bacterium]
QGSQSAEGAAQPLGPGLARTTRDAPAKFCQLAQSGLVLWTPRAEVIAFPPAASDKRGEILRSQMR